MRVNGDIDRSKTTLGAVMGHVNKQLQTPGFLPSGVTLGTEGDSKFFLEFLMSMCFSRRYVDRVDLLPDGVLYGSFVTPFVIMFSIPVAIIGALLALALTHQTINLFSMIGLIMLFGLVAKNGILLVDYANTLRKRGLTFGEAIVTAGGTRLRPIVMTTAAMVFGMLPLATGHTEGGEIRMSMGIVLIGGSAQLAVPHAVPRAGDVRRRRAVVRRVVGEPARMPRRGSGAPDNGRRPPRVTCWCRAATDRFPAFW